MLPKQILLLKVYFIHKILSEFALRKITILVLFKKIQYNKTIYRLLKHAPLGDENLN